MLIYANENSNSGHFCQVMILSGNRGYNLFIIYANEKSNSGHFFQEMKLSGNREVEIMQMSNLCK